ncbi:hypothetical protein [Mycobacteroides abscessus]|uniref:hypothetical protein n=1 Tax=Mycobacteroides abscessus TaxID=36809 RepID=UPI0009A579B0|nr:hypothetical protein [Mycobacteroides abscessus]SKO15483.1 Uncharacterised protein [Mycobacteroides abscessus subsp. bolletii]SKX37308.1 Uncharacterised protein [Mycobacteroides abscessus subsp. bolletii]
MNYNAALILVVALILYSLVFLFRQLFRARGPKNSPVDVAPLVKSLALGTLLTFAGALVQPAALNGDGETARLLLRALSDYFMPWLVIAIVLFVGFPVLIRAFRLALRPNVADVTED